MTLANRSTRVTRHVRVDAVTDELAVRLDRARIPGASTYDRRWVIDLQVSGQSWDARRSRVAELTAGDDVRADLVLQRRSASEVSAGSHAGT
jgi:hypothetical protein